MQYDAANACYEYAQDSAINTTTFSQTAAYIWTLADLLRGDFKQSQYGRVILPFTTSLVFMEDDAALNDPGVIRTIYDPTAGTGGFLSAGMEYV